MLRLSMNMDDMGPLAMRLAPRPDASSVNLFVLTPSARIALRHASNGKSGMGVGYVVYVFKLERSEVLANSFSKALAVSKSCATEADTSTMLTSVLCSILGLDCDIVGETFRYSVRGAKFDYSGVFQ